MFGLEWSLIKTGIKLAVLAVIVIAFVVSCSILARASDVAVGDSIALGTGHALGVSTYGRVGAGSCEIVRRVPRGAYAHAVISAGINDGGGCVAAVRARVRAGVVVWILPAPINPGRAAVLAAVRPGDGTVSYACAGPCTKSNFHPASYAVVAAAVRAAWSEPWVSPSTPTTEEHQPWTWTPLWFRHFGR
jgi:hypothetical protein